VKTWLAVERGEVEKHEFYEARCQFPESVRLVPFAIDTYGRWGPEFTSFLQGYCTAAAAGNTEFYNLLITRARNIIQVAHANAVGEAMKRSLERCISTADHPRVATTGVKRMMCRQV
jgi:hypothetical protein